MKMTKKKLLSTFKISNIKYKNLLSQFDITVPKNRSFTYEEINSIIHEFDAILVHNQTKIDANIIKKGKKLKIISNFGVGFDNIDYNFAKKNDVIVTNTPDAVTTATAEVATGLLLSIARKISYLDRKLRDGNIIDWGLEENYGVALKNKTLGILGMGRIGKTLAKIASALGMNIIYNDKTMLSEELIIKYNINYVNIEDLFKLSDFISIHLPLNKYTHHLVNEGLLNLMKTTSYIINTSRGGVIDEQLLVKYLKEKRIGGAGLDVFENEPTITKDLLNLNNVVLTPHIGTDTFETSDAMLEEALLNIANFFNNKSIKSV
jgi:glyoxylate reductase